MSPLRSFAVAGWLAGAGLLCGCAAPKMAAYHPPHVTDPPHHAPQHRALRPPGEPGSGIVLGEPSDISPHDRGTPPDLLQFGEPEPLEPRLGFEELPEPIPEPDGPRIFPDLVPPAAEVELEVRAPERQQLGARATYRITVRNVGDHPLRDVVLESEFDDALEFPGTEEKAARQTLGGIAPGERKEVALTLDSRRAGRHCTRFRVLVQGREAVWKSVCIEYVARRLDVSLVGPSRRTVGSRAEFTLLLTNRTSQPLRNVSVVVHAPPTLRAREASADAIRHDDALQWDLGEVAARERIEIQVEYECLAAAEEACVTVEVSGDDVPDERIERCLKVSAVQGMLDVQVADTVDPVSFEGETEFVATVRNRGLHAAREVRVEIEVPANFRFVEAEVREGGRVLPLRGSPTGQVVLFDPLPNLAPDATAEFRIRVRGREAGTGLFRATVRHAETRESVEAEEPTTVRP